MVALLFLPAMVAVSPSAPSAVVPASQDATMANGHHPHIRCKQNVE